MASSPTGVDSTTLTNDDTSGNRDSAIFTPTISDPMVVHIAPQVCLVIHLYHAGFA